MITQTANQTGEKEEKGNNTRAEEVRGQQYKPDEIDEGRRGVGSLECTHV